jgi:hypothetical protein
MIGKPVTELAPAQRHGRKEPSVRVPGFAQPWFLQTVANARKINVTCDIEMGGFMILLCDIKCMPFIGIFMSSYVKSNACQATCSSPPSPRS